MSKQFSVIYCTVPDKKTGIVIARELVEKSFVACVNIVPAITSIYSWKNEICEDDELLLIMKTIKSNFSIVKDTILSLHPYDVPEIISLQLTDGHSDYLDWILENVN